MALTDEGEKAFIAADPKNANRLKAIDDFVASPTYQNEVLGIISSIR